MVKRGNPSEKKVHKKSIKTSVHSKEEKNSDQEKLNEILVNNFVSLQKVMTNLSIKFDNLSGQISKLLELFEISAKSFSEKDFDLDRNKKDNKEMLEKLDNLIDQNKIIARGLTLLHEGETKHPQQAPPQIIQRGLMQQKPHYPPMQKKENPNRYQKSIHSNISENP